MAKITIKKNIWDLADKTEVTKILKNIKRKKIQKEQLEAEIKEQENIIKGLMDECAETEFICGTMKVQYLNIDRKTFDSTTLKKENPDLYNRYTNVTATRRFTVR